MGNVPAHIVAAAGNTSKQFLCTTALGLGAAALAPVAALLEGGKPTPAGATEIAQIRDAAQVFNNGDFTHGGGLAREAVLAQLRYSARLLEATCPARLRPDLLAQWAI